MARCPYKNSDGTPCRYEGSEEEVNLHRVEEVGPNGDHADQPQAGSNLQ